MSDQLPISPGLERFARSVTAAGGFIAIGGTKRMDGMEYYRMARSEGMYLPEVDVIKSRATGGTECEMISEMVDWPLPSPVANCQLPVAIGPEVRKP